jgi:hypothetical protein
MMIYHILSSILLYLIMKTFSWPIFRGRNGRSTGTQVDIHIAHEVVGSVVGNGWFMSWDGMVVFVTPGLVGENSDIYIIVILLGL